MKKANRGKMIELHYTVNTHLEKDNRKGEGVWEKL